MREKGVVEWFNAVKGYGFIKRDSGEDLFVHYSCIVAEGYKELQKGDRVEFDVVKGRKGMQAEAVTVLGG